MNIKPFIILCFSVVFFLSITAATASDNLTDDINVTFDEQMWAENLTDISVDLPEEAEGDFCVKVNDEVIYNQTISNKSFKVPVTLPKEKIMYVANVWPPLDCKNYKVSAFYNSIDLNISKTLKVMTYHPDYSFLHFPEEVLQYDSLHSLKYSLMLPRSSNGFAEIYVDERFITRTRANGPFLDFDDTIITNLALGNHTLKLIYENDTYYNPINKTFDFEVVNALITVPKTVIINHDDCISVDVRTDSSVEVYLDSVLICWDRTQSGMFVLSLEKYLRKNSREVRVVVSNKDFTREKTVLINVTYDLEIYSPNHYIYGEENVIELYLPDTLNNNLLTVTINGVRTGFTHPDYIMNNILEVDISNLRAGNYTLTVSYSGDERFEAKTNTLNFTVTNQIITPDDIIFKDGSTVYLNLPGDAMGNLNLYLNGVLFKSVKLINGHAEVRLDGLSPGKYLLNAAYAGNDYSLNQITENIYVSPKITIDCYFTVGEDKSIILEVPTDCKGLMIVHINENQYTVKIKNGKAVYSLKNLKIGEYEIRVDFIGENGYNTSDYYEIEVAPAKIRIEAQNVNVLYKHKYNYRVKVFGRDAKPLKNVFVKFKFNKKTYKVKTNSKGIATLKLKNMALKKYKIKIRYGKVKLTRKVSVKLIELKDIKIKKSKAKLEARLYKKLKSKTVTFKINKKTYKVKTNSKGVAKIKIKLKNIKAGEKITYQATYLKSTVKKKTYAK